MVKLITPQLQEVICEHIQVQAQIIETGEKLCLPKNRRYNLNFLRVRAVSSYLSDSRHASCQLLHESVSFVSIVCVCKVFCVVSYLLKLTIDDTSRQCPYLDRTNNIKNTLVLRLMNILSEIHKNITPEKLTYFKYKKGSRINK